MNIDIFLIDQEGELENKITVGHFKGVNESDSVAFKLQFSDMMDDELIVYFNKTFKAWLKSIQKNDPNVMFTVNVDTIMDLYDGLDDDKKLCLMKWMQNVFLGFESVEEIESVNIDNNLVNHIAKWLRDDSPEEVEVTASAADQEKTDYSIFNGMDGYDTIFSGADDEPYHHDYGNELQQAGLVVKKSKVFKNANKPHRSYNRHGLIISDSRDDIARDEKMIKAFLKEFIPGKSKWIRQFRKVVLQRWIKSYCISKKGINRMQKEYRRNQAASKYEIAKTAGKTIEMTKLLLGRTSMNDWFNPNI